MTEAQRVYAELAAGTRKRMPMRFWDDPENLRQILTLVWERDGIAEPDVPARMTRAWLQEQRLVGALNRYGWSPWQMLDTLWPGRWKPTDTAKVPKAPLKDDAAVRALILAALAAAGKSLSDAPHICTREWIRRQRLYHYMIDHHRDSRYLMFTRLWPGVFDAKDFPRTRRETRGMDQKEEGL